MLEHNKTKQRHPHELSPAGSGSWRANSANSKPTELPASFFTLNERKLLKNSLLYVLKFPVCFLFGRLLESIYTIFFAHYALIGIRYMTLFLQVTLIFIVSLFTNEMQG